MSLILSQRGLYLLFLIYANDLMLSAIRKNVIQNADYKFVVGERGTSHLEFQENLSRVGQRLNSQKVSKK